jgi:hypothetical protein
MANSRTAHSLVRVRAPAAGAYADRKRTLARILGMAALVLFTWLSPASASMIQYGVTPLGAGLYRYTYTLRGFDLALYAEVAIAFDPALYGPLSNGLAGSAFDLLLLQPGNPPGAFGYYSALALIPHPPLDGPFQVDVVFPGPGLPGPQPYFVNQFDHFGQLITVESGMTEADPLELAEPAVWAPAALVWMTCAAWRAACRRRAKSSI